MIVSRPLAGFIIAIGLVAAACGGVEEATTTTAEAATQPPETTATTTSEATTTTAESTTTTTASTTTSSTLAGSPTNLGPEEGDVLSVVGVAHDDVLNVREAPGLFNTIIDTIEPTGTAVAAGTARDLGQAIWIVLDTESEEGWSNLSFLAYEGATDDATAFVVEQLGEVPTASSMDELGRMVAETHATTEPQSRIVMSVAGTSGDLGEVTYDVIGIGDDSVYGYRLHVFGEYEPDAFRLRNVERTAMCLRGIDEDELCV